MISHIMDDSHIMDGPVSFAFCSVSEIDCDLSLWMFLIVRILLGIGGRL